jgi:hypothetical protein
MAGRLQGLAFNQSADCLVVTGSQGLHVYSNEAHRIMYRYAVGAVRWAVGP